MERIEIDARTSRCAEHLDREDVRDAIFAAKRAFLAGDVATARAWIEVAELAADLIIIEGVPA